MTESLQQQSEATFIKQLFWKPPVMRKSFMEN
jgi:hypothetical protein